MPDPGVNLVARIQWRNPAQRATSPRRAPQIPVICKYNRPGWGEMCRHAALQPRWEVVQRLLQEGGEVPPPTALAESAPALLADSRVRSVCVELVVRADGACVERARQEPQLLCGAFARRQAAGHAEGGRQHADNNVGCATSHHALARASRLKLCGGGGGLALCPTRSAPFAGGRTAACWYAVAAAPPPSALWPQRREGSAQAPWSAGTRAPAAPSAGPVAHFCGAVAL